MSGVLQKHRPIGVAVVGGLLEAKDKVCGTRSLDARGISRVDLKLVNV